MPLTQQPFKSRSIVKTSVPAPIGFAPPIGWIKVAQTGTVVAKGEDGVAVTYTSVPAGVVIPGPFSELTSTTSAELWLGDGDKPAQTAALAAAAGVSILDAGNFTAKTNVEDATQEIYQHLESAHVLLPIPLAGAILAAGTPVAAFADNAASNPGITLDNSKAVGLRWNNNATQVAVWLSIPLPLDLDPTAPMTVVALASKSGATSGDATTFTVSMFAQTVGAIEDAGADLGGATTALAGAATAKTVSRLTLAVAVPPTPPAILSLSIKPTNGTLGTDDAVLNGLYIEYKRKLQTS